MNSVNKKFQCERVSIPPPLLQTSQSLKKIFLQFLTTMRSKRTEKIGLQQQGKDVEIDAIQFQRTSSRKKNDRTHL